SSGRDSSTSGSGASVNTASHHEDCGVCHDSACVCALKKKCGKCFKCKPVTRFEVMRLCSTCGNKRCPHISDCALACTGSNEPKQPGSIFTDTPSKIAVSEPKCIGCGRPFKSPDHDPRCSSCVESGTGPEPRDRRAHVVPVITCSDPIPIRL